MGLYTIASKSAGCSVCHLHQSCLPPRTSGRDASGNPYPDLVNLVAAKGSIVYRAGDPRRAFFLLKSGSAKAVVFDEHGRNCVTTFFLPADLIGLSALGCRTYVDTLELLERSSICELPAETFERQCAENREMMRGMFNKIATASSLERSARMRINHITAAARLADFLMEISTRMACLNRSPTKLTLSMSRHDIASHLSLAGETVSRAFHRLEGDGLIAVRGRHVEIRHLDALFVFETDNKDTPARVGRGRLLPVADGVAR